MRMQELRQDAAILAKPKDLANQDGEHSAQDVLLRAEAEVRRIPSPARWRPRHPRSTDSEHLRDLLQEKQKSNAS